MISTIPQQISNLSHLHSFDLSENAMNDLSSIGHCQRLSRLWLGKFVLNCLPDEIGRLLNLHSLSIEEFSFSLLPSSFSLLSTLSTLYLMNGRIGQSIPSEIFVLLLLKNLNLSTNRISIIPSQISSLQNLVSLNLERNMIVDISPLFLLQGLKILELSFNKIETIDGISALKDLETLELANNLIKEVSIEVMNLYRLRTFIMSHNPTKVVPSWIYSHPSISVLSFNDFPGVSLE